ncbi:hypothetical protein Ciccas_011588 [Cichlidogyrus casuarinus]|uniref:Reverse transcriptase domain-containing protein n=1 Tax=Cichlidogyrus casuarinus TaxID=1844966 RepID=A0ABD2PQT9_9PLAT
MDLTPITNISSSDLDLPYDGSRIDFAFTDLTVVGQWTYARNRAVWGRCYFQYILIATESICLRDQCVITKYADDIKLEFRFEPTRLQQLYDNVRKAMEELTNKLKDFGFKINVEKTMVQSDSQSFN